MTTVDELVAAARTWIGVPFHHQGRNRLGVDCAGFVEALLTELELLPADYRAPRNYGRLPSRELAETIGRYCRRAPEPVPGALLTLSWGPRAAASHLGLYTGATLIHAWRAPYGVSEQNFTGRWRAGFREAYLIPGVAYV